MPPRLSVIIPNYNCLPYLPKALDSVRRQQVGDYEIIVVDDGSTDNSPEWLATEAARDPHLVVITMPGLMNGPSLARNAGIAVAKAPIVAFLDADDFWYPDAISDRLALHESDPSAVLSFGDFRSVSPEGRDLGTYFAFRRHFHRWVDGRQGVLPLGQRAMAMIFAEAICGTSTVLAARDSLRAIGGFRANLIYSQDWECWLRLAGQGQVWCVPRIVTGYLVRPNSQSRDLRKVLAANRQIFDLHKPAVRAIDPRAVRLGRAELAVVAAAANRAEGRHLRALGWQLKATLLDPSPRACRAAAANARGLFRRR
jgi:glycosyltransferase involved in cell wall biosynthesis